MHVSMVTFNPKSFSPIFNHAAEEQTDQYAKYRTILITRYTDISRLVTFLG